jgi:hypothetical protein
LKKFAIIYIEIKKGDNKMKKKLRDGSKVEFTEEKYTVRDLIQDLMRNYDLDTEIDEVDIKFAKEKENKKCR